MVGKMGGFGLFGVVFKGRLNKFDFLTKTVIMLILFYF
ncbi:hypothetical protein BSPWISOXPB_1641 [uncultured Gammaproteobacteria bacterium]|nr:hypothetical protein BSPWISOXPB_1641 [uncultured Gammaproteobacteria bacterium]